MTDTMWKIFALSGVVAGLGFLVWQAKQPIEEPSVVSDPSMSYPPSKPPALSDPSLPAKIYPTYPIPKPPALSDPSFPYPPSKPPALSDPSFPKPPKSQNYLNGYTPDIEAMFI